MTSIVVQLTSRYLQQRVLMYTCGQEAWHTNSVQRSSEWTASSKPLQTRCAGSHVLDEAERSLHDALCVLSQTVKDSRVLYGGGYPEMQMAKVLHTVYPSPPICVSNQMLLFAALHWLIKTRLCSLQCLNLRHICNRAYKLVFYRTGQRIKKAAIRMFFRARSRWQPLRARSGPSPPPSATTQVFVLAYGSIINLS